jgi:predicted esterase
MRENEEGKGPVEFEPMESPCTAAVICLHGFGDEPEGWADFMAADRRARPSWAWVFPRAKAMPQPCYGGQALFAWAKFAQEEVIRPGGADYDSTARNFNTTISLIHRSIDTLRASHNLPAERVAVMGFSQGAAAAAAAALTYPERLGGIGIISGWLIKPSRQRVSKAQGPNCGPGARFFVSHGTADSQVTFECAEQATDLLRKSGASVVARALPKLDHDAGSTEAVPDAMRFLDDCLCTRESTGANQAQTSRASGGNGMARPGLDRAKRSKKARSSA